MNSDRKKILVTGGAGYIGSHTIVELLKHPEYDVVSIDNFINSFPQVYGQIEKISNRTFKTYDVDLVNPEATRAVFEIEKFDAIVHFAALKSVPESVSEPLKYYDNNLNALSTVLKLSQEFNVKRFVFSSSCSIYGNLAKSPVNENTVVGIAESPYAHTKQIGESIIANFSRNCKDLTFINLRYFNPAGAHDSALIGEYPKKPATSLIPVITETAAGLRDSINIFGTNLNTRDGSCIRDYVHVMDIAKAHVAAVKLSLDQDQNVEVFNLGTGNGVSVLEAISAFERNTDIEINKIFSERRSGDIEAIFSDCTKSEKELGWKAEKSIDEMLISAWKWQQSIPHLNWTEIKE